MRILSAAATRELDRRAVEEWGIPSLVLMENAAIGLADAVGERFPAARRVAIVCGPGNNGGDGLALARHLAIRGYDVRLALATAGREPVGDAAVQLAICRRMGLPLVELGEEGGDSELQAGPRLAAVAEGADLVVDALFGTGLTRPLKDFWVELVEAFDGLAAPVLAVDLPSGLSADLAEPFGPAVTAAVTVTFASPKPAHVFHPAAAFCGEVIVADLGVPPALVDELPGDLYLLQAEDLVGALPPRRRDAHKGDFGHVLVVAGSPGKSGAAVLAARSAVACGAGLVTAAVPESVLPAVEARTLESMVLALPATAGGALAFSALEGLASAAEARDVVALGPGLGTDDETVAAIRAFVAGCPRPLVLDADGINAFAGAADLLADRRGGAPLVLTPHPGELGRLLGLSTAEVQADRPAAARRAAETCRAVVLLKGQGTLVAAPEGGVWVVLTGNPGMATGGTGDVLTGALVALLAQLGDPLLAAQLAAFVHGDAGDRAAAVIGEVGLTAGDVLAALPAAVYRIALLTPVPSPHPGRSIAPRALSLPSSSPE